MPNNDVVIHISDFGYISNILAIKISKLHIERNIGAVWSGLTSNLLETYTRDLNSCPASCWTRLWSQGMDKDVLVVCKCILNITFVENPVRGILLCIS